jgi:hypothetical protein
MLASGSATMQSFSEATVDGALLAPPLGDESLEEAAVGEGHRWKRASLCIWPFTTLSDLMVIEFGYS